MSGVTDAHLNAAWEIASEYGGEPAKVWANAIASALAAAEARGSERAGKDAEAMRAALVKAREYVALPEGEPSYGPDADVLAAIDAALARTGDAS